VQERVTPRSGSIEVQRPPREDREQQRGSQSRLHHPTPGNELSGWRCVERPQQAHPLRDDQLAREGPLSLKLIGALQRRQEGRLLSRNQPERPMPAKLQQRLDRPCHRRSGHPEHHAPSDAQPGERRHGAKDPRNQDERRESHRCSRSRDSHRQHRSGSHPKASPILSQPAGAGSHGAIVAPVAVSAPVAASAPGPAEASAPGADPLATFPKRGKNHGPCGQLPYSSSGSLSPTPVRTSTSTEENGSGWAAQRLGRRLALCRLE